MTVPADPAATAADAVLESLAATLFQPMGVEGVYARTSLYEGVIERLAAFLSRQRDVRAEVLCFPPVMSRRQLEISGYLRGFPNLLGCLCALEGSEAVIRAAADSCDSGGDWTASLAASDLVLSPAACYPLYPLVAARGRIAREGLVFDVAADCFRREPSRSLDRWQSFRMREFVRIGTPADVMSFREAWMTRAVQLAVELGLPCTLEAANDPFFGRIGQILAVSQLQQSLKFELLIRWRPAAKAVACMSFNYHRDYFAQAWGLEDVASQPVHTACVAFGMDRLAVALFAVHGVEVACWPQGVRRVLEL